MREIIDSSRFSYNISIHRNNQISKRCMFQCGAFSAIIKTALSSRFCGFYYAQKQTFTPYFTTYTLLCRYIQLTIAGGSGVELPAIFL